MTKIRLTNQTQGVLNLQGPEGFLINGKIVTSVSSGSLTVAIKTLAGTDPSTTDPVYCRIDGVVRAITSALSTTNIAGYNRFNAGSAELATKEIDYFVYLQWSTTDNFVQIGFSRLPYLNKLSDGISDNVTNSINEKVFWGNATSSSNDNDKVVNIGRFNAILSAGPSYTWSIPATSVIINRPIFETRELIIGGDIQGFSLISNGEISYRLIQNTVFYMYKIAGTSNSDSLSFRLPFNKNTNVFDTDTLCSLTIDNGVNLDNPGRCEINSAYGYGIGNIYKTMSGGVWTASGHKQVRGQGFYNI